MTFEDKVAHRVLTWNDPIVYWDSIGKFVKEFGCHLREFHIVQGEPITVKVLLGVSLDSARSVPELERSIEKFSEMTRNGEGEVFAIGAQIESDLEKVKEILNGDCIAEWTFYLAIKQQVIKCSS